MAPLKLRLSQGPPGCESGTTRGAGALCIAVGARRAGGQMKLVAVERQREIS